MNTRMPIHRVRMRSAVAGFGTPVTLSWIETTGGATDPVTGQVIGGVSVAQTATAKALIHTVGAATKERLFAEIEEGDVMADFDPEAELDGKTALTFTIDGRVYVQKEIASRLSHVWDALHGPRRMLRTVLLRLAT